MDHMRRDEIGAELEGYQHKIRIGFASVTVGDVVQLIAEVERQAKEIAEFNTEANRLVSVNRALVKDRDKFEADYLKYYDIGHNCSIQLRHAQEERDAALAEVERLKDTRPAPCHHCGSTDPKRSAAFCKRCEWQQ